MFKILEKLYSQKKLTDNQLNNAINRGWISQEEANRITKVN
ncbi:MAG: XkdX family protein [Oscillospiraceae bacterium]